MILDAMAHTWHSVRLPLLPKPMTSPRTPFFWLVNLRVPNVVARMIRLEAVARFIRDRPLKSCTSAVVNGVVSDLPAVYSPGRRRKKKAICAMSAVAVEFALLTAAAVTTMCRIKEMGIGLTRCGGGSSRVYDAVIRLSRKSSR